MFQNYNGSILNDSDLQLLNNNRGFLYGDGFFESMRYQNGKILFYDDHIERIKLACAILKLQLGISADDLEQIIIELIRKNDLQTSTRIRMTVFRESNGTYLPEQNNCSFIISVSELSNTVYELNEKGLTVDFYTEQFKTTSSIANIKSLNSLVSVLASMYARDKKLDDAILMNNREQVLEGTGTNLFIVKNNVVLTPPLADGCVDGVMRRKIFVCADNTTINCKEQSLSMADVLNADEVFLTNVSKGIQWVGKIREKKFECKVSKDLFHQLLTLNT